MHFAHMSVIYDRNLPLIREGEEEDGEGEDGGISLELIVREAEMLI